MADEENVKTAFCSKCRMRHRLAKWPEGCPPPGTAEAATITGASSAEELGDQVRERLSKPKRRSATEAKLSAEEKAERRAAAARLGRKLAGAPFSIAVLITAEPEWRSAVSEQEITDIADAWVDFAEAWGVHATGKVIAAVSLALAYATTGGKVYSRVKEKEIANDIHGHRPKSETRLPNDPRLIKPGSP